jgi:hypothetical protein
MQEVIAPLLLFPYMPFEIQHVTVKMSRDHRLEEVGAGSSESDSDDSGRADSESGGGEDADGMPTSFQCIFSPSVVGSAAAVWADAAGSSGLDAPSYFAAHRCDMYARIRLVNFLRAEVAAARAGLPPGAPLPRAAAEAIAARVAPGAGFWSGDACLAPVLPEDALLMALGDNDDDEEDGEGRGAAAGAGGGGVGAAAGAGGGGGGGGGGGAGDLAAENAALRAAVDELREQLAAARAFVARTAMDESDPVGVVIPKGAEDDWYFDSYAHVDIHAGAAGCICLRF